MKRSRTKLPPPPPKGRPARIVELGTGYVTVRVDEDSARRQVFLRYVHQSFKEKGLQPGMRGLLVRDRIANGWGLHFIPDPDAPSRPDRPEAAEQVAAVLTAFGFGIIHLNPSKEN